MASRPGIVITLVITVGLCAFAIGILVGYFSKGSSKAESDGSEKSEMLKSFQEPLYEEGDYISQEINKRMNAQNIRENLKYLSAEPHLAGSERDVELAKHIEKRWKDDGLDRVRLVPYDVLLSFPKMADPNKVQLLNEGGGVLLESKYKEETLRPEDENPNFIHSFNSYAPKGDVTGDLVYVNFGRVEDFDELEKLKVSVKRKICIMRYGKIYRGNKVKHAEERGAIGVILYLDPEEVALNGTDPKNVYPNSWWMPGTAMQRGTVFHGNGDPTTPGYPSLDGIYRIPDDKLAVPSIPAQPIGYADALELLKLMDGPVGGKGWVGKLPTEYKVGPGFKPEHKTKKVRLIVNNELRQARSYNVIGVIKGHVEPDRYVLIGNHRDSWGYGAVDASTGTSQLLEVSRVLGELYREGWKPRRTIVFCSWGAEEQGLIGSYEWVEENLPKLQDRSVGYINVDICASGDALYMDASPLLFDMTWDITKQVPDPKQSGKSVYDVWKMRYKNETTPKIETPGSGSDHASFTFYAGIPIVNMWWRRNKAEYDISIYPAYHTGYETFFLVDKYIDPGFKIHQSCSQISGLMLHKLSNSLILPYNATRFADVMSAALQKVKDKNMDALKKRNIHFDTLEEGISKFKSSAQEWHTRLENTDKENPLAIRMMNDQFLKLERVFIKPDGLPDQPFKRHMIFAPSKYDSYAGGGFPALSDLLYGITNLSMEEQDKRWNKVERHLSDLLVVVHYATHILKPNHEI